MAITLDDDSSSCVHRNTVIWTSKQLELDHIAGILIILRTIFQEWLRPIAYVGQAKWNKGGKRIRNFVVWSVVEGTIWKGKKKKDSAEIVLKHFEGHYARDYRVLYMYEGVRSFIC